MLPLSEIDAMDPLLIAIIALLVGAGVGFGVGRGAGRSAGLESGRAAGLREGRAAGLEEGTEVGLEEGRRLGVEEGHSEGQAAGFREGREAGVAEGRAEGRTAALEEGKRTGLAEGMAAGREEGRKAGLAEGRGEYEAALRSVIDAVKRGRVPEGLESGSAEAELLEALAVGWAPREIEREAAMREAVMRVSAYLARAVREPLDGAPAEAEAEELRERIERALGALQDLDFFIEEIEECSQYFPPFFRRVKYSPLQSLPEKIVSINSLLFFTGSTPGFKILTCLPIISLKS